MTDPSFIRLENLSKSFLEGSVSRHVLQDATAGFTRGEITAIIGKSGSGKSTLLNLISGIDQADGGAICLDGIQALPPWTNSSAPSSAARISDSSSSSSTSSPP